MHTIVKLGFLHSFESFFCWPAIKISQENTCIRKDSVCVALDVTTGEVLF